MKSDRRYCKISKPEMNRNIFSINMRHKICGFEKTINTITPGTGPSSLRSGGKGLKHRFYIVSAPNDKGKTEVEERLEYS